MSRNPYDYERVYSAGEMDPYSHQPSVPAPPRYGSNRPAYLQPGEMRRMKILKCPDNSFTYSNTLAVSSSDFDSRTRFARINDQFIFNIVPVPSLESSQIGPTRIQREWGQFSINKEVLVEALSDSVADTGFNIYLGRMDVEISFLTPSHERVLSVDSEEIADLLKNGFENQMFSIGQPFVFDFHGNNIKGIVTGLASVPLDVLQDVKPGSGAAGAQDGESASFGILTSVTTMTISKSASSLIELKGASVSLKANAILQPDFRFEDLGIGGLDKEFSSIFRRAFASRIFPPDLVDKLGIQHAKGILLYGPPGTGKTLMARQIGKMLNAVEPLIVSGPEILNKFVGQSEENVRKLFEPAEKEYRERGDASQLHIIIFDELDAICKQRGSRSDSTGVGDTVVNQLLAKMDGVDQLNNILIIGMTNRKELIDDALLRPGRLEVHIEVGLPDEDGRLQILNIHTAKIRTNNILDTDVNLEELASLTKNYSGAEIAGVVKSASSYAFYRHIKVGSVAELTQDVSDMKIQRQDFMNALDEVKPAFGIASEEFEQCATNGIIMFAQHISELLDTAHLFVEQVQQSKRSPLVSLLLHGPSGSGKTALASKIAQESGYPFVRLISPENLIGLPENQRIAAVTKAFTDSYKSPLSLIVIDNIERLLEWVPIGARFSNSMLQTLLVLIKKQPPRGRRLLIIGTTGEREVLTQMDMTSAFSNEMYVRDISTLDAVLKVAQSVHLFNEQIEYDRLYDDLSKCLDGQTFTIGIKKLLLLIETARQDPNKHARLVSEIRAYC
ncbi:transport between ER and Golgi ATPase protein [Coemansia spiralis]|uniref:Vesicular-fusion protein SEC18 n=2 Tax=Coemansia TaxID=4863 RepID=A0A9W8KXE1_9FUNG|nr:transport between ER and Golgi ATPase protein [Coemansia umbellata]KAJ2624711.1 transport between ER and Golgi ATPase protein [Coemansia sp. RSA 1358]KAJ2678253.1 transport between ER and Golgi ATPase protein [Coemansia spiralis]